MSPTSTKMSETWARQKNLLTNQIARQYPVNQKGPFYRTNEREDRMRCWPIRTHRPESPDQSATSSETVNQSREKEDGPHGLSLPQPQVRAFGTVILKQFIWLWVFSLQSSASNCLMFKPCVYEILPASDSRIRTNFLQQCCMVLHYSASLTGQKRESAKKGWRAHLCIFVIFPRLTL